VIYGCLDPKGTWLRNMHQVHLLELLKMVASDLRFWKVPNASLMSLQMM
jgi:hypothetical protein